MAETLTLEEVGRHSTQADKASQKSGEVCLKVAEFRKYEVIARAHIEAREGDVGEMIAKLRAFADQHHERPRYDSRGRLVAVHNWAAEAADLLAAKEAEIAGLREALGPFVKEFEARREAYIRRYGKHPGVGAYNFDNMPDDWEMENSTFTMRDYRRARAACRKGEAK